MKLKNKVKFYIKIKENNTIRLIEQSHQWSLLIREEDLLKFSWLSKKQLDLYLFRHKEIKVYKVKKQKFLTLNVLYYAMQNIERLKRKYFKNN